MVWNISMEALMFLGISVLFQEICANSATMFTAVGGSEERLEEVMIKMERDVLDFAAEMERVYAEGVRCSSETLNECPDSHFHECNSLLPFAECKAAAELARSECPDHASGNTLQQCSGIYDFQTTSVRLAPRVSKAMDGNPLSADVKEAFCYSKQAEAYMANTYEKERLFWEQFGVEPPVSFFGTENGFFRIHPAIPSTDERCGMYDPTRRPWYIAATSGPKDVVLILDVSGSMDQRGRLDIMREAAIRIVDTLALGDHVGVVLFSDSAHALFDSMMQATTENKEQIINAINTLATGGGTNFLAGFNSAFDLLQTSKQNERTSSCTSAFLFLSDGEMTAPEGVTVSDVINSINQRKQEVNITPQIFLYGLGASAAFGPAAEDPKAIACETGGMWSHVQDGGDLADTMSNYYKLFALGLGDGANENFVAWVEPYTYNRSGIKGTSVSAPVYDRSVSPSILVGAVGILFPMVVMDRALGLTNGAGIDSRTLEKLVARSTAICPNLNINNCVLQSLRQHAGGSEALCIGECNKFVGIVPSTCSNQPDLPSQFWNNLDSQAMPFVDRACCAVGATSEFGILSDLNFETSSDQCLAAARNESFKSQSNSSGGLSTGAIAGIAVASAVVILGVIFCYCFKKEGVFKRKHNEPSLSGTTTIMTNVESQPSAPILDPSKYVIDTSKDVTILTPGLMDSFTSGGGEEKGGERKACSSRVIMEVDAGVVAIPKGE